MKKHFLLFFLSLTLVTHLSKAQKTADTSPSGDSKSQGISVSPAHFHLSIEPGDQKTKKIAVTNNTDKTQLFQVKVYDFNMNGKGKSSFIPKGEGEYSLSKYMNISPTFFEVASGEKKEFSYTVSIPDSDEGNRAAWSVIMIEQAEPKKELSPIKKSAGTIALGVIPTYAFGVYIYQNPPNVSVNKVEITDFAFTTDQGSNFINIETKNIGDGIAYCNSYVDLINNETGEQRRLEVKRFTIVPSLIRDFKFQLPELQNGSYTAIGVLDFENAEEIQAAKMQFTINQPIK
ncbi:DUF916 domain-containing protein [Vicingaceae bacterium]|nr:DUF916 domain-containing protein [Vicingaceae bacterium]